MASLAIRLAVVSVVLAASACGGSGHAGEIPSNEAARAYLDHLVDTAQQRDLVDFCTVAGGENCDSIAQASGGVDAIPSDPPNIAGTRLIATRTSGQLTFAGGRLFILCGTDGRGEPYRTETLVSTDYDGDLYAINPVYWSGFGLAISQDTRSATGGEGIDCPET